MQGLIIPQMGCNGLIHSVLVEAQLLAEQCGADEHRPLLRSQVALVMRATGNEDRFRKYVANAMADVEKWREQRFGRPERDGKRDRLEALEADAKRLLLEGKQLQAEQTFMLGEELREDHLRRGIPGAHGIFLEWILAANDLPRARDFLRGANWGNEGATWANAWSRVYAARRVAQAYIAAGRDAEGLEIVLGISPGGGELNAHDTLCFVGEALWRLGAIEKGFAHLREASKVSVAWAQADGRRSLSGVLGGQPLSIARIQLAIGDDVGARVTLLALQKLAADPEYDPPPPRPADIPAAALWLAGPTMKPEAKRWLDSRAERSWLLARAGLDEEALMVLGEPVADQPALLMSIVRGQAGRGNFEAAFGTFERLSAEALTAAAAPSQVTIKPDGSISFYVQSVPTRPVESLQRREACRLAAFHIASAAAGRGDAAAFARATALGRKSAPERWTEDLSGNLRHLLRRLARSGGAVRAYEIAQLLSPNARLGALLGTAEGIGGVYSFGDDMLLP